jgi:hypothetical protein
MKKTCVQFLLTLMAVVQVAGFGRLASAADTSPVGGSIRFGAATAKIIGDTLRLENSGGGANLGVWSNPADRVE